MCRFEPSDLCGYNITTPDNCPTEHTYSWTKQRLTGSKSLIQNNASEHVIKIRERNKCANLLSW